MNSGVIPALTDRNDYIICDDRDHASIVDGRRLSFSQQLKYKHNDMADLEKQLQKVQSGFSETNHSGRCVLYGR